MRAAILATSILAAACGGPSAAPAPATAALPATTDALVRVSLADLRGSDAWPAFESLLAEQRPLLDAIERDCGLRVLEVLDTVTLAGDGEAPGLSLLLLEGRFRKDDAHACFATIMADRGQVTAREVGGITELSAEGFAEKVVVRWLRDGAVLVPFTRPTDRAHLERVLAGPRLADGPLGAELAGAAGAIVAAGVGDERRGPPRLIEPLEGLTGPVPPRRARARIGVDDGLRGEMRLVFASDAEAAAAAEVARRVIAEAAADTRAGALGPVLSAITVEARGAEVTLRGDAGAAALGALAAELAGGVEL